MKKASFVVHTAYQNNKLFDLSDAKINRDNCMYPFYLLKQKLAQMGVDLSTQDINPPEASEIVIYNEMPSILPTKEAISKSYLMLFESELIRQDNWDLSKHKHFHKIFTWHDDFVDNVKYFKINFAQDIPHNINSESKKERLCTMISGNKKVNHPLELYSQRVKAIRWFEKHHPEDFDLYGMGWDSYVHPNRYVRFLLKKLHIAKYFAPTFPSYKGKVDSKKEVLEKYKFSICYENGRDIPGYITEKIFDSLFAGCVPVYWGANNIDTYVPKECFVDRRNFDSYEALYDYMVHMTDEEYNKYMDAITEYLKSEQIKQFSSEYFAELIAKSVIHE
ncbi:MAG: hypothetical protein KU28_00500 [Sulfurovum sp. PC08-66]|nr:MAG: hypothetical protein KU28_00500 [Sulfurovum sp. PC08-66]KIM12447.1 MAG: hypothetical protein KU37_00615 [Sulfuricurvum sp. PC08-66]